MRLLFIIIVISALMLSCTSGPAVEPEIVPEEPQPAEPPTQEVRDTDTATLPKPAPDIPIPQIPELDSGIRQAIEEKVCYGKQAEILPLSSPKLKVGDTHVFGVGIGNWLNDPVKYVIKITPQRPRDEFNNGLDVYDLSMIRENWLQRTDFSTITINPKQCTVIPIIIDVQDKIAENKNTATGTYYFKAEVFYLNEHNVEVFYAQAPQHLAVRVI